MQILYCRQYEIKKEGKTMNKTIFVAGVYGVGKDYLCDTISETTGIKKFSASQLISNINKENYAENKDVKDKKMNQVILREEVHKLLQRYKTIILTGHMCILDKHMNIEVLPQDVYANLEITSMVLLKNKPNIIVQNLIKRDGKEYNEELIDKFQRKEEELFIKVAKDIKAKSLIIDLLYDDSDLERFQKFLEV